jgi:hypothetical protein
VAGNIYSFLLKQEPPFTEGDITCANTKIVGGTTFSDGKNSLSNRQSVVFT